MEQKIVTGIKTLIAGKDLTPETAADSFSEIMNGTATEAQTAAFLTALSIKGETPSEIAACAEFAFHVVIEREINIDRGIGWAVERPHD